MRVLAAPLPPAFLHSLAVGESAPFERPLYCLQGWNHDGEPIVEAELPSSSHLKGPPVRRSLADLIALFTAVSVLEGASVPCWTGVAPMVIDGKVALGWLFAAGDGGPESLSSLASPEELAGQDPTTPEGCVWRLGCELWEWAVGKRPFPDGDPLSVVLPAIIRSGKEGLGEVEGSAHPEVVEIARACLRVAARDRPRAAEVAAALARVSSVTPAPSSSPRLSSPASSRRSRRNTEDGSALRVATILSAAAASADPFSYHHSAHAPASPTHVIGHPPSSPSPITVALTKCPSCENLMGRPSPNPPYPPQHQHPHGHNFDAMETHMSPAEEAIFYKTRRAAVAVAQRHSSPAMPAQRRDLMYEGPQIGQPNDAQWVGDFHPHSKSPAPIAKPLSRDVWGL